MQESPSTSSEVQLGDVVCSFSKHLVRFKFEKALEYIDDIRKIGITGTLPTFISVLSQFGSAESQYFSLSFSSKISFRKEIQLKDTYTIIEGELDKLLDECELEPTAANKDLEVVLRQFSAVASSRIKLIDFYTFISASYRKSLTDDALDKLSEINNLLNNVSKNVTRFPQLNNVCTEVSILQKLFKVQQDLLDTPIIDTVIQMKSLHESLSEWLQIVKVQGEPTKRSFLSSFSLSNKRKMTSKLALLCWIHSFHGFLVAKVNLYYYLTLNNYTPSDLRLVITNSQPSFLQNFHTFIRRSNAQLVTLIMDRMDLEPLFNFGYHKLLKKYSPQYCKPITGIKGHFPPLMYLPNEKVFEKYHPSVCSLIQELSLRSEQTDKIKFLHDLKSLETFFIVNIEKRVYLAVVFDRKISEKDPFVQNFFSEVVFGLRGSQLIQDLKLGFK